MKFWSQKFPRQARLRSEKSLDGPRWALRQKKFLRNKKTQELFRGKQSQSPRHLSKCPPSEPEPQAPSKCPSSEPEPQTPVQVSAKRARAPGACPGVRQAGQSPRQPAKRQQLSQNPRYLSLTLPRVLSISRSGILHKRSES